MKVGDLIKEHEFPEIGLIVKVGDRRRKTPYLVWCPNGKFEWFEKKYIEEWCEVVSAGR